MSACFQELGSRASEYVEWEYQSRREPISSNSHAGTLSGPEALRGLTNASFSNTQYSVTEGELSRWT